MKKYIVLSVFALFAAALAGPVLRVHAAEEIDAYCVAPTDAVPHGSAVSLTIKFSDSDKSNDFIVQGPFKILKYKDGVPIIVNFKRGNEKDDKGKENPEKPTLTFSVALSPKHKLPAPATEAVTFTYYVTHKEGKRGNLSTTSREQQVDCSFTVQHETEKTTPSKNGEEDVSQKNIAPADLGINNIGTLPTSPFYFFKEWGRGLERFFTFNAIKKAELELRITNEKAAEAIKVQETKPDDSTALTMALENYTKAAERLEVRLAKLKETSENPNTAKLLERLNEQTLKHALLFNQLARRWDTDPYAEDANAVNPRAARDNHLQGAVDVLQKKIQEVVVTATEKDSNIEQKAKEQIRRAEKAIDELKSKSAEFELFFDRYEEGRITVNEHGVEPAGIAIGDPGVNGNRISTNMLKVPSTPERTIERQTPKRDFGDRMKAGLETAGSMLANAKTALTEKKFGEAFGLGRAAEVNAWKGLRLFADKDADGRLGTDEMKSVAPRPGTDADSPRMQDKMKPIVPSMPNVPVPEVRPSPAESVQKPVENMYCTQEFNPVCGSDGKTYSNACMANAAGVPVSSQGECGAPAKAGTDAGTIPNNLQQAYPSNMEMR